MARVILVISTVCLILVGASAGSGSLRGALKTANSSGLVANADVQKEGGVELQDLVDQSADVQKEDNVKFLKLRRESNLPWPFKWPCPKKGPWPQPPGCAEGGGELQDLVNQSADVQNEGEGGVELQDLVNQSADVQKEDNVKLSRKIPKGAIKFAKKVGKKAAKEAAKGVAKRVAREIAGDVKLQDLANQSADVQKEDIVKLSWHIPHGVKQAAKKDVKLQDLANQSADVQKEDNVELSWNIPGHPWGAAKKAAKKAWGVAKQVAKYAAGCYISTGGARFDC